MEIVDLSMQVSSLPIARKRLAGHLISLYSSLVDHIGIICYKSGNQLVVSW